jgi:hypothetical protein
VLWAGCKTTPAARFLLFEHQWIGATGVGLDSGARSSCGVV